MLMELFLVSLRREVSKLHKENVRLRFIGELEAFPPRLLSHIRAAEEKTRDNSGLTLSVAANYGGRWDITQAARRIAERVAAGELQPAAVDPELLQSHLCLADLPEPDLFIRTGGEQRISNFLLWQLAYSELYFTETLWPDFNAESLEQAFAWFASRQRRFGMTGAQVESLKGA